MRDLTEYDVLQLNAVLERLENVRGSLWRQIAEVETLRRTMRDEVANLDRFLQGIRCRMPKWVDGRDTLMRGVPVPTGPGDKLFEVWVPARMCTTYSGTGGYVIPAYLLAEGLPGKDFCDAIRRWAVDPAVWRNHATLYVAGGNAYVDGHRVFPTKEEAEAYSETDRRNDDDLHG